MTKIIAFESSADETSVAVVIDGRTVVTNSIATQIVSHQRFGGIVPEIASRHHIEWVTHVMCDALEQAGITPAELDGVAVTYGPGLVGALLVGLMAAKTFALVHQLPLLPVNHLAGHIAAAGFNQPITYPAMALMVSGGHTELVYMPKQNVFYVVGETRDDAAGESFDKVGRLLGLPYPAGKAIDQLAAAHTATIDFPIAMAHDDNYDFSFSGLKSAVINHVHNAEQRGETLITGEIAASFQQAVVAALVQRTQKALHDFPVQSVILAGGVAANRALRGALTTMLAQDFPQLAFNPVPLAYTGDNAAMIAAAGYWQFCDGVTSDLTLNTDPGLDFPLLPPDCDCFTN